MGKKGTAMLLSLIFMGLGQLFTKFFLKGLILILIEIYVLISIPKILPILHGFSTLGTHVQSMNLTTMQMTKGDNSVILLFNGGLMWFVIAIFIVLYIVQIFDAGNCVKYLKEKGNPPLFWGYIKGFYDRNFTALFLIPAVIGIFSLIILPMILTVMIAFTNYSSPDHIPPHSLFQWVAFQNFQVLYQQLGTWGYTFINVFIWTLIFAICSTILNFVFGMILALLTTNKNIKFKGLWRGILILPYAVPGFVSIMVFNVGFSVGAPFQNICSGILIHLAHFGWMIWPVKTIGITAWYTHLTTVELTAPLMQSPLFAKLLILAVNTWLAMAWFMMLISGALTNVSESLYEAAEIDGATKSKQFRFITLPIVLYQTAPILVLSFAFNFNNFNIIYLLTGGGPLNASYRYAGHSDILLSWVYNLTVSQSQFAIASVIAIFIFVFIAIITLIMFLKTKMFKEEGMIQ